MSLETDNKRLREALIDANSVCRMAFQVINGMAIQHGTHVLGYNVGALADALNKSLKSQHEVIHK